MKLTLDLSDFEHMALRRVAEQHGASLEDMALAYLRDGLRIENSPAFSRRRMHRESAPTFEPLTDYDTHPNSRY